jgi:hypothetical protein
MALAGERKRAWYTIEYGAENLHVAAIPRGVDRVISKRRQAVEVTAAVFPAPDANEKRDQFERCHDAT